MSKKDILLTKKYLVRLTSDERCELENLVHKGKTTSDKRLQAQILLKAERSEEGPGWVDEKISEAFEGSTKTIERVRQRLIEEGLEAAINREKAKKVKSKRLDGEQEAHLVALACSEPPEGNARWVLRLLADRRVEWEYVERLSHETVRQALKKTK